MYGINGPIGRHSTDVDLASAIRSRVVEILTRLLPIELHGDDRRWTLIA